MKKNKKVSLFVLGISLLVLSYTFYESEIKYSGDERNQYIKYYLISSILVAISIFSLTFFKDKSITAIFLKRGTIKNLLVILVSTYLGLMFINGYLFIKQSKIITSRTGIFEFYNSLKTSDKDVTISMFAMSHGYNFDKQPFPLADISNKRTIFCNENGYFAIFESDRYGFNNPDNEWEKNEIDFLLIGDSYTHGSCVNEPDTISGNLRKMTNNKGVLNFGYSGNGPLREYAGLIEYLPIKKIKRVLWIFTSKNDLKDLKHELNSKILVNYLNDTTFRQNLPEKQKQIDNKLEIIFNNLYAQKEKKQKLKYKNIILSFIKLSDLRRFTLNIFKSDLSLQSQKEEVTVNILKKFSETLYLSKKFSEHNGAKFYFVYLPEDFQYGDSNYKKKQLEKYKKVLNLVKQLNIPIIDIKKDLLDVHPNPKSLFPIKKINKAQGHYNEDGYKSISEIILKTVNEYEK